ncbi:MAG: hypothetical protein B6U95_07535 [Thermofilum sp. ex4484_82]|nr:MAG: hypothetical protein B6U95_07535 [Thermofilum sp. ex4484_82]OYT37074.1 MAG: hypothetical protein B6U96_07530 [Archaeoglobales archaeon ex4484_92]
MSLTHDSMAYLAAHAILKRYRDYFGNVFISPVSSDFPRPDFVFLPSDISETRKSLRKIYENVLTEEKKSYPTAFEFKTPFVHKHEYIMGVGQAVTYNASFVRSFLVIPEYNMEGFDVLSFIYEITKKTKLSIGLISYEPDNVEKIEMVKEAEILPMTPESLEETTRGVTRSYAYWRETKPEEVYEFLRIAEEEAIKAQPKEDIREKILERLWEEVLSHRFKEAKRKSSFLLNYKLFFSHIGLWDKSGRLTSLGKYTLIQGQRFGKESSTFRDIVTYLLLRYGGHYNLLRKIYMEQTQMSESELNDWKTWIETVKARLSKQNFYVAKDDFRIDFPRLPFAYEKIFSGIVLKPYFVKGRGLNINWVKIIDVLNKGASIFSPIETE